LVNEEVKDSGSITPDEETIIIPVHTYHRKTSLRQAEERRRRQERRDLNRMKKELEDR